MPENVCLGSNIPLSNSHPFFTLISHPVAILNTSASFIYIFNVNTNEILIFQMELLSTYLFWAANTGKYLQISFFDDIHKILHCNMHTFLHKFLPGNVCCLLSRGWFFISCFTRTLGPGSHMNQLTAFSSCDAFQLI